MLNGYLKITGPLASIIISTLATWIWVSQGMLGVSKSDPRLASFMATMGILAQISAAMLGFMMAVLAILASISDKKLIRNMQRTGHYHGMLRRIFINNIGFGLLTSFSLFVSLRPDFIFNLAPLVFWASFFSSMLFSSSLVMLWQILMHLKPSSPDLE